MGILPLKKRVNHDKCSFTTKQRMFGVFAIDKILRYRGIRFPGSRTLCHPDGVEQRHAWKCTRNAGWKGGRPHKRLTCSLSLDNDWYREEKVTVTTLLATQNHPSSSPQNKRQMSSRYIHFPSSAQSMLFFNYSTLISNFLDIKKQNVAEKGFVIKQRLTFSR